MRLLDQSSGRGGEVDRLPVLEFSHCMSQDSQRNGVNGVSVCLSLYLYTESFFEEIAHTTGGWQIQNLQIKLVGWKIWQEVLLQSCI